MRTRPSPHRHLATLAGLLLGGLLAAPAAEAAGSIRFCFKINAEYQDNARGEDQWTCGADKRCRLGQVVGYPDPLDNPADRVRFQTFRGGLVEIWEGSDDNGRKLTDGGYFLGDGSYNDSGCTRWLTPETAAGDYFIRIHSEGQVRGHHYKAISSENKVLHNDHVRHFPASSNGQTETIYLFTGRYDGDSSATAAQKEKRRVFQQGNALAFALARDTMGVAGLNIVIRNRNVADGEPSRSSCGFTGFQFGFLPHECIDMNLQTSDRKTVMTHELGHILWRLASGRSFPSSSDYDAPSGPYPCHVDPDSHKMRSIEFQGLALNEGLAHVYSASVWRDAAPGSAAYWYDGNHVDLAQDTPYTFEDPFFTQPFMMTHCYEVLDYSGLGNELDWARTFWAIHAVDPDGDTSLRKIANVLRSTDSWNNQTAFSRIDARMNRAPLVHPDIRQTWNTAKNANGIAHP